MKSFKNFLNEGVISQATLERAAKLPPDEVSTEFWQDLVNWGYEYMRLYFQLYDQFHPDDKSKPVANNLIVAIFTSATNRSAVAQLWLIIERQGKINETMVKWLTHKDSNIGLVYNLIEQWIQKYHSLDGVSEELINYMSQFKLYSRYIAAQLGWSSLPQKLLDAAKSGPQGALAYGMFVAERTGKLPEDVLERIDQDISIGELAKSFHGLSNRNEIFTNLPDNIAEGLSNVNPLMAWLYWKTKHKVTDNSLKEIVTDIAHGSSFIKEIGFDNFIKTYSDKIDNFSNDDSNFRFEAVSDFTTEEFVTLAKEFLKIKHHLPPYFTDSLHYNVKAAYEIGQLLQWDLKTVDGNLWHAILSEPREYLPKIIRDFPDKVPPMVWGNLSGTEGIFLCLDLIQMNVDLPEKLQDWLDRDDYNRKKFLEILAASEFKSPLKIKYLVMYADLSTYMNMVIKGIIELDEKLLNMRIKVDTKNTNFNFIEDIQLSDESKKLLMANEKFKRYYLVPRKHAKNYNENFAGFFVHSTHNITPFVSPRQTGEICISSLDANRTFNENLILAGAASVRLLYDFDCYSIIDENDPKRRRYATDKADELQSIDLDNPNKSDRLKKVIGQEIGDHYYDEGFADIKELDLFFVTGQDEGSAEEASKKLKLPHIEFKKFQKLLKTGQIINFMYDILDGKHIKDTEEDPEEKYAALVKEALDKHCAYSGDMNIVEDYSDCVMPSKPATPAEQKIKNIFSKEDNNGNI